MEGTRMDGPNWSMSCKKLAAMLAILVLTLVVGAAGINLTKAEDQKAQKTSSDDVNEENEGYQDMETNPLLLDKYQDVTQTVSEYYLQLGEETEFIESYDEIQVYTKYGRVKGTYVAFVRYDMKIKDIYTKVPGLGTLYVEKNKEGIYQVNTQPGEEEKQVVDEVAGDEDVQTLIANTQTAYQEAVQSDALLEDALTGLRKTYEDSTGSR